MILLFTVLAIKSFSLLITKLLSSTLNFVNFIGEVGNFMGHVGNLMGHVGNFMGQVGNPLGQTGNPMGEDGTLMGLIFKTEDNDLKI